MSQIFLFSSRRRHTRCGRDWSSDVCSSDLDEFEQIHGKTYYFAVKVTNGASLSTIGMSDGIMVDETAPDIPEVVVINRSEERRVGKECRYKRWGMALKQDIYGYECVGHSAP